MKKRVLILSAGIGTGHIKAADALEKAFAADGRVADVMNHDALQSTNKLFQACHSSVYTSLVRSAPDVLGWWYKTGDDPWRTHSMRQLLERLNTKPLVRLIRDFAPQITVCTHFMPASIMAHLMARHQLSTHLSVVVTDFDVHAKWLSRACQRYFVAIDETRVHLEMLGIPGDRITVSGIPIDPVFQQPVSPRAERLRLGLNPEQPVLLLSAGAVGVGPVASMVERMLNLNSGVQVVIVCGRNDALKQRILQLVDSQGARFKVLGYTEEMHKLMKMADIFIGKPGGMTTAEAITCGLPICVVSPIPGQEERNSDHLLEEGIAIKCNDLLTLPFKLETLLEDADRLSRMKANALRFAQPAASTTIVDTLFDECLPPLSLTENQDGKCSGSGSGESVSIL